MEIFDSEVLVGAVQVVGVLSPTEKQCVDSQNLFQSSDNGNRAPFADHDGFCPEGFLYGGFRGHHEGTIGIRDEAGTAVILHELDTTTGRTAFREKLSKRLEQLVRVLIGDESASDLCRGP